MTTSVVGALAWQLEKAEIQRAKGKPTESLDAYDYYLRGMACFHQRTREAFEAALPLFYKAIELDPEFASAYAMAGWCHAWRKLNGWMTDRDREIAEGVRLVRRAVELGPDDAVAPARGGHALGHLAGDLAGGIALTDRALALDPNSVAAWFLGGFLRVFAGGPDAAIKSFEHAMRLSPLDPEMFRMQTGVAFAPTRWAFRRRLVMGGEVVERSSELPGCHRCRRRGMAPATGTRQSGRICRRAAESRFAGLN